MTTNPSIEISGFTNEDVQRVYQLKVGTLESSTPYDITDAEFEMEIRDSQKNLALRLTSNEDDAPGIEKTDANNGFFSITIRRGSITPNPKLSYQYDLLMQVGPTVRRLWGGSFRLSLGTTVPA